MPKTFTYDKDGHQVFKGFVTSKEIEEANMIADIIRDKVPSLEKSLKKQYAKSLKYNFILGKFLTDFIKKYGIITFKDQQDFWIEVSQIASSSRKHDAAFYENCYKLSKTGVSNPDNLSWEAWTDILSNRNLCEDKRIFNWIDHRKEALSEAQSKSFIKKLKAFLKKKDTSIFSDEEVFAKYDLLAE